MIRKCQVSFIGVYRQRMGQISGHQAGYQPNALLDLKREEKLNRCTPFFQHEYLNNFPYENKRKKHDDVIICLRFR